MVLRAIDMSHGLQCWYGVECLCAVWRGNVRVLATHHHLCCGAVVLCWSDNSKLVLCCGLLWWCSITTVTTLATYSSMLQCDGCDVSVMMT